MSNFRDDLMGTLKNLFQKIYDDNDIHLEYRYYEIWNMALTEMTRSLNTEPIVTCQVTVSPQWELIREVLKNPLDTYMLPEAKKHPEYGEIYLANLSMEATKHQSDSSDDDNYSGYYGPKKKRASSDASFVELNKELVKPDFILFHVTAGSRRVMLIVEVKPGQLTRKASEKVFRQAETQAAFAFDVWQQESVVYSLMLIGRKFYLEKFSRTKACLPHNKRKEFDMKSYKPTDSSKGEENNDDNNRAETFYPNVNSWRDVFDETIVTHRYRGGTMTAFTEMRFTKDFKEAIDEVMMHSGMGGVLWGNC